MFIRIRSDLVINVRHIVCVHKDPDPVKKNGTMVWYVELLDHHAERITEEEFQKLRLLLKDANWLHL